METRSLALQCLKSAIKENKFSMFESQFNAIKKEYPQDLLKRDNKTGKTLLHLALDHPNQGKIAHYLINAFTSKEFAPDGHQIIFSADDAERSALWYAAQSGLIGVLMTFLELGTEYDEYAWLSKADKSGHTVLHVCSYEALSFILTAMKKSGQDINKIINLVDKDGRTPLYLIYDYLLKKIDQLSQIKMQILHHYIADLAENGAKLFLPDNHGRRPLDIHFELPFENQQAIFLLLDRKNEAVSVKQEEEKENGDEKGKEKEEHSEIHAGVTRNRDLILTQCKAYLDDRENHPNLESARQFYLRYTGRRSLLELILAHLEYDTRIPARNEFEWQEAVYDGYHSLEKKTAYSTRPITIKLDELDENILQKIPHYLERCGYSFDVNANEYRTQLADGYQQDTLARDRVLLGEFIGEMEASLNQIKMCVPAKNFSLQLLGVIALSLSFMAYLSGPIVSGICYGAANDEYNELYDKYYHSGNHRYNSDIYTQMRAKEHDAHSAMTALIVTAILGTLIPALGIFIFMKCSNVQARISHRYWNDRTSKLQELVTQLESLGKQAETSQEIKNMTTTLRSKLTLLESDQYLRDLKRIFNETITTLKTLQGELNRAEMPISLFFQPKAEVVIDIADEHQPLLKTPQPSLSFARE